MKKTIGVYGLFLLLLAFTVSAHTLTGVVTDDGSGNPVNGATVKITYGSSTFLTSTSVIGQYSVDFNLTSTSYATVFVQRNTKWNQMNVQLNMTRQTTHADITLLSHPQCSDLYDNDRDGFVDMDDRQCTSPSDNSESSVTVSGSGNYAVGLGVGIMSETEHFKPRIFMCPHGKVFHNNADGHSILSERVENYAFEGEQIQTEVMVWDKNGIEKIKDVYVTLSDFGQQAGDGLIEANCDRRGMFHKTVDDRGACSFADFNARELEEELTWNPDTMARYVCTFTVETPNSMEGEYWVAAEVEDLDGLLANAKEKQWWYLNPEVSVTVTGSVDFGTVRPGTSSYSDTLLIENTAASGSGVLLDMAISGSDFYDPTSSGAKCPTSNVLTLDRFRYHASNGAYRTTSVAPRGDGEGYFNIPYEVSDPSDRLPIISGAGIVDLAGKPYEAGNVLSPGAEIALTFRLDLPEPCNGDFSDGSLYFWGTAI
ncbi:MAG: carboxypeptidase regulatory-like domain-containing protein [DPANN group archaeon]|nr:carboxypeptidase regulatory-like domain-containing protein [DPANN group archaeon]